MSSKQIGKKREVIFLGIDVAKKTHWGQLLSADGIEIGRPFSFNRMDEGFEKCLRQLNGVEHPVAGMESTGPFGKNLKRFLEENGVTVIEINPIETKAEGGKRVRKLKTDKVDALNIARVTREKYFNGHRFAIDRDLEMAKVYGRCCEDFIDRQRKLKQQIKSHLFVANPGLEECLDLWSASGMAILRRWPTVGRLKKADHDEVALVLVKASHGQFKPQKVDEIIAHCSRFYTSSDEEHHRGIIVKKRCSSSIR